MKRHFLAEAGVSLPRCLWSWSALRIRTEILCYGQCRQSFKFCMCNYHFEVTSLQVLSELNATVLLWILPMVFLPSSVFSMMPYLKSILMWKRHCSSWLDCEKWPCGDMSGPSICLHGCLQAARIERWILAMQFYNTYTVSCVWAFLHETDISSWHLLLTSPLDVL